MRWTYAHTLTANDRTKIYVGLSATDCGSSDAFTSYGIVSPNIPSGTIEGMSPFQITYAVTVPAGGGTFTFFLNTQRVSGTGTFVDASANLEAVFHLQG